MATFAVPKDLSSDGGPEFTANLTKDFLKNGKSNHEYHAHTVLNRTGAAKLL